MKDYFPMKGYEYKYLINREGMIFNKISFRHIRQSDCYGYRQVSLSSTDRVRKTKLVHILMAETFLGHVSDKKSMLVVNHIDGNKANNSLYNLEIVTRRDNISICYRSNSETKSSKYVGASKNGNKWQSTIAILGVTYYLGCYNTEEEASYIYFKALEDYENNGVIPKKETYKIVRPRLFINKNKHYISRYNPYLLIGRKRYYLGIFNNEQDAIFACRTAYEDYLVKNIIPIQK